MALDYVEARNNNITFPEKEKIYDIIESSGNIRTELEFLGFSTGAYKPQFIFKDLNKRRVLINPSYIIEMEEFC